MKRVMLMLGLAILCVSLMPAPVSAQTTVPGHAKKSDKNGNGISDAGVFVNGHYTSLYAYDGLGQWYWDLGDGRVYGTVADPSALDQESLTSCRYVNNYRADYGDTPYMDNGWIQNHIVCSGVERGVYHYVIVSGTDPRYTGNPNWAEWGTWEYAVLVISGEGNIVRKGGR